MQSTVKKTREKLETKKNIRDTLTPTILSKEEDKIKKSASNASTPRNFIHKTSADDIYGQKKRGDVQSSRASKKVVGATQLSSNVTPKKDPLKSSSSSISQLSTKSGIDRRTMSSVKQLSTRSGFDKKPSLNSVKIGSKIVAQKNLEASDSARKKISVPRTGKELPFVNVTVNSPIAKRKLNMTVEPKVSKTIDNKQVSKKFEKGDSKDIGLTDRQRSKTRTLNDNEVKVLKTDAVDNNTEMLKLSKKLGAEPKAFYVDLDSPEKMKNKSSDEEVSYEDDFESYESDFDSYHSENSVQSSNGNNGSNDSDVNEHYSQGSDNDETVNSKKKEREFKEGKDEERLDSGNFELREQRSANKSRYTAMEFILEGSEDDKRTSLTDEGFQDMSSSSAVSSMRTHVDVLDRPLFIDFSKSKENKRKRKLNERLKQRATDLLSMITLHEMSFTLFEMKPIPYDVYMATFGRINATQIAVQTYDDGITEAIQTEEILYEHKWTQHPTDFSKHDVYINSNTNMQKYGNNDEDYLSKFTFLVNNKSDVEINNKINLEENYKENPLRIYFEQKDGVGSCEMLPYESYKSKIENNDYNVDKLRKFLKKTERKISNILSRNDNSNLINLSRTAKLPFSKGFVSISPSNILDENFAFLKNSKISNLIFSQTKTNLILSIHKKSVSNFVEKCIICIWDISVARREPIKILIAVDNVAIGRFKGNSDGIFVAALEDGSIHLWDLSEEPTWRKNVASEKKDTNLVEVKSDRLTQTEIDREWNLKNSNVEPEELPLKNALLACAYTSSAGNIASGDVIDCIVGLEFMGSAVTQEGGRKIIGQICSLQRIGIITLWSIVQEKTKIEDMGRAFWSKMKLEKTQVITLLDHIDVPIKNIKDSEYHVDFNLNSAKRRLSNRKQERTAIKKEFSRPKSTSSSEFDVSRPASGASIKKVLPIEKQNWQNWESGMVCCDLKIIKMNKSERYLIAKNCGEVLCCSRIAGVVKINKYCVTTDTSTVIRLDVSPHGLPYFLAATDAGTVNLYSIVDARVLLTLDCRNGPPTQAVEKCHADSKGRFISSTKRRPSINRVENKLDSKLSITSLHWSDTNPCCLFTLQEGMLASWDLTYSDICAKTITEQAGSACAAAEGVLALLTPEGEIQIHRLSSDQHNNHKLDLFKKYVTLL